MATRTTQQEVLPSLVPAPAAGIASLILPGLGQILARQVQQGLLILGSTVSIIGLLAWRVHDLARREVGAMAMVRKALQRQPLFMGLVLLGTAILWLWTAWDAYRQAQPDRRSGAGIFVLILILFFTLGWQIGEIELGKVVRELPDAWPPLARVLWPWPAAVERETEKISASADILVPCDEDPPPPRRRRCPANPT